MPPTSPPIHSRKNDRLRLVRSLGKSRARRKLGKFVLEGTKVVEEALRQRPESLEQVFYCHVDPLPGRLSRLVEEIEAAGLPVFAVAPDLYAELSQVETPQPVLAVARQVWTPLGEALGRGERDPRLVIACCGVADPGNVGTILRASRFFGCGPAVFLAGSQDPWNPKVVRASSGALFAAPPARAESPSELIEAAQAAGLQLLALTAHEGLPLGSADLPARALLLLGAEGGGLPEALESRAAFRVTIPPRGEGHESLNVAVAAGIALHAWVSCHGA